VWFLFGFITLISFSIYFGLQRYRANWNGTDAALGDITYKYSVVTHKGSTNKILIGCDVVEDICFSIKIEKWWDKFFKAIGISVEHQVGVDEFDRMFYLITDNESLCSLFSESYELQDRINEINETCIKRELKIKKLHCRHGRIWLDVVPKNRKENVDIDNIAADLIPTINNIAELLKDKQALILDQKNDPFIIKAMVILAISTGLAINGAIQIFRIIFFEIPFIVDDYPLFYAALPWGIGVIGALIFAALIFLGRTARTHLVLIELILVGSFGAISTAYTSLRDANIDLDTSAPEHYAVKVHDKRISRSSKSTSYYIKVDDWNNGTGKTELRVSRNVYNRFKRNQIASIVQMPGYMGYRWVADIIKN